MKLPHIFRALPAAGTLLVSLAAPSMAADAEWKLYTYFGAKDKPTMLHRAFAEDVS